MYEVSLQYRAAQSPALLHSRRALSPSVVLPFQTSVLDLKEKASSLASAALKKDNRLKTLEISLEQKREECVKLESKLKKVSRSGGAAPARKRPPS